MTSDEIFDGFCVFTAELLGVESSEIKRESNLVEDFDADSLDLVELSLNAQQKFGVKIPRDALPNLTTVGSVCDYIEQHQHESANR
jgi:acyl carrier protein